MSYSSWWLELNQRIVSENHEDQRPPLSRAAVENRIFRCRPLNISSIIFIYFDFLDLQSSHQNQDFFEISRRFFHLNLIDLWYFFDALFFLSLWHFYYSYRFLFACDSKFFHEFVCMNDEEFFLSEMFSKYWSRCSEFFKENNIVRFLFDSCICTHETSFDFISFIRIL
jgi:hypothetical protein